MGLAKLIKRGEGGAGVFSLPGRAQAVDRERDWALDSRLEADSLALCREEADSMLLLLALSLCREEVLAMELVLLIRLMVLLDRLGKELQRA